MSLFKRTNRRICLQDFLLHSLIASLVLTVIINVLPRLFPKQSRNAERRIHQRLEQAFEELENEKQSDTGSKPRVKVFFPWKEMLVISIVLTVLLNLVGFLF